MKTNKTTEVKLYLGLTTANLQTITEQDFNVFLRGFVRDCKELEGLTVTDGDGFYKNNLGNVIQERSKVITFVCEKKSVVYTEYIPKLAIDYANRFNQECILRTENTCNLKFHTQTILSNLAS